MGNIASENVLYDGVNVVRQLLGNADPSAGAGVAAEVGSIYQQTDGTVWAKTSAPDTGWEALGGGGGGGDDNHQTATVIVGNADSGDTADDCDYLWTAAGDTAIQDALNDVDAQGGGYVHLKRGYYDQTGGATIQIPSNVILQGDGMESTTIYNESGVPVFQVSTGGQSKFTMRDITIESSATKSAMLNDGGQMLFERVTWRQIAGGEANVEISTTGVTSLMHILFQNCIFERGGGGECVVIDTASLANPSVRFDNCEWINSNIGIRSVNAAEISLHQCSLSTVESDPVFLWAGGTTILHVNEFRVFGVYSGTCRFVYEGSLFASVLENLTFDGATRLVQDCSSLYNATFRDVRVGSVTECLVTADTYVDVIFDNVIVEDLFDASSPGGFLSAGSAVNGIKVLNSTAQYNTNPAFYFAEGAAAVEIRGCIIEYNAGFGVAAHAMHVVPDALDGQLVDVIITGNTWRIGDNNSLLVTEAGGGSTTRGTGPFWFTDNYIIGAETGICTEAFLLLQGDALLSGIHIKGNQFFGNRNAVLFNPLTSPIVNLSIDNNDFNTNGTHSAATYPSTLRINGADTILRNVAVTENRWHNAYGPAIEFNGVDGYENCRVVGNEYADNWGNGIDQVIIEFWMRFAIDEGFASLEISGNKLFNNSGVQQNCTVFDIVATDSIKPGLRISGNYAKSLDPNRAAIDFNGQDVTNGTFADNQFDEVTGFLTNTTLIYCTIKGNVCTGLEAGVEGYDPLVLDHCTVIGNVFQSSSGLALGLLIRAGSINNVCSGNVFTGYLPDIELEVGADNNIVVGNQAPTINDSGAGNQVALNI